jgi:hypothetical protein
MPGTIAKEAAGTALPSPSSSAMPPVRALWGGERWVGGKMGKCQYHSTRESANAGAKAGANARTSATTQQQQQYPQQHRQQQPQILTWQCTVSIVLPTL